MLFAVDVGNTTTVLGVLDGSLLLASWRITTRRRRTSDEYVLLLRNLFDMAEIDPGSIDGAVVSCVVPPAQEYLLRSIREFLEVEPLAIGPGVKTGMPILYENPREVGADRIVNAVAAYDRFDSRCIVVDFGTATTFDAVSDRGEYLGGIICPGIDISAEALFLRAAKLPRVEIGKPERVIGKNTAESMKAGLFYGYVGLVDGILARMSEAMGGVSNVLATGGVAHLLVSECVAIAEYDPLLTLSGLRIIFERNAVVG